MPLNVLPKTFQSYPKVVTELEDSEKLDLFDGPIPGDSFIIFSSLMQSIFSFLIIKYFVIIGECWVKFLQNINKSFINEAQMMLSVWLGRELEKNVIIRVQSDR